MDKPDFLQRLAALRSKSCEKLPTPELAVLTRTTARLRRSGMLSKCLQPGETAPDFQVDDTSLYRLLATGPVVINFFRGLWCMFCQTELEAYAQVQDELDGLGCHYLAVSPQALSPETSLGYASVYDRGNEIARRFGLVYELLEDERQLFRGWGLELDEVNGCGQWELPLPATYLVARDRTVAYQFVDVDFRSRCCPDVLVQEIRKLVT